MWFNPQFFLYKKIILQRLNNLNTKKYTYRHNISEAFSIAFVVLQQFSLQSMQNVDYRFSYITAIRHRHDVATAYLQVKSPWIQNAIDSGQAKKYSISTVANFSVNILLVTKGFQLFNSTDTIWSFKPDIWCDNIWVNPNRNVRCANVSTNRNIQICGYS